MTDTKTPPATELLPNCDIVMKGGITSGVVYPKAICALAEKYTLKSIGGTSAGAIAAAAAAAAEYHRHQQRAGRASPATVAEGEAPRRFAPGFKGLDQISGWLGQGTHLRDLFQPTPEAAPVYRIALAALHQGPAGHASKGNTALRIERVVWAVCRETSLLGPAALWALPVWTLAGLCLYLGGSGGVLGAVSLALVGAALFVAGQFYTALTRLMSVLPRQGYGLCPGRGDESSALSNWLSQSLNELAGLPPKGPPLTFGHLWQASNGGPIKQKEAGEGYLSQASPRDIDLQMMTTSLTHGRPYRIPFDEAGFYFDEDEMRAIFPDEVVDWLVNHQRTPRSKTTPKTRQNKPLCRLPEPWDLPVVVATRMSLSFPVLLSAVRLYQRKWDDHEEVYLEPVCFSDGGIVSNFPIHLFDAALPRWPTFGVSLRTSSVDTSQQESAVQIAQRHGEGSAELWNTFESQGGGMVDFFVALLDTMQNWADNAQSRLPGYSDRIAYVGLAPGEGGLNLTMESDVIESLAGRGQDAGNKLVSKFHPAGDEKGRGWLDHRWVRYRVGAWAVADAIERFADGLGAPQPGDESYDHLVARAADPSWDVGYKLSANQPAAAATLNQRIQKFDARKLRCTLEARTPHPRPELRLSPRVRG